MDQATICHCWRTQTCSDLPQSRAISRNLPPPPEGTIVRQGLHTSDGSPGKNGDRVIVRLATLTQWAVSAMLNTGRIHIFMRVDLLFITRRTRARANPNPWHRPNVSECTILQNRLALRLRLAFSALPRPLSSSSSPDVQRE